MKPAQTGLFLLLFSGIVACAPAQDRGSVAQQEACRQRADQVFLRQNPNESYRADLYASGGRDSPFGGGTTDPTAALGARYERARLLDTCLRNATARPAAPAPIAPAPAAAAVAKP